MHLLRLLGLLWLLSTTGVAVDVGEISSLLDTALDGLPSLANDWWHVLSVGDGVTAGAELVDGALDKGTLVEAGAEEDGVDDDEDPGALLEENGGAEEAEPEHDLEDGDDGHAEVVVVLDKITDGVAEGGRGWLLAWLSGWLWLESWDQVGAGVGCNVEDRIDGEWQDSKSSLLGEEPDKGHDWIAVSICVIFPLKEVFDGNHLHKYCTFSSPMIASGLFWGLPERARARKLLKTTIP